MGFTVVKRLGTRVNTRVIYALPVTFPLHPTKFPRSTSATRAISVLSSIILPLQTFFSRVLLALACFYRNGAIHSHARSIARAWLKRAHPFDRCGIMGSITSRYSEKEPAFRSCRGGHSARESDPSKRRKSSLCSPEFPMNPRSF